MRKGHPWGRLGVLGVAAAIAVALGLALLSPRAAFADSGDFYVSVTGTDNAACSQTSPCATISAAIAAAGSAGTIHVGPGTFMDALSLQSGTYTVLGDPAGTTLEPAGDVDLIVLGGSASLTIEHVAINNPEFGYIVRQTGGEFSLVDGSMTGGQFGVQDAGGSVTLSDDMITGISILPVELAAGDGPLTVADTTIQGGTSGIFQYSGTVSVTDSTITQTANAAIPVLGGSASIASSTITNSGAGLLVEGAGSISVSGSILADNQGTIQDPGASVQPTFITGANCDGSVADSGYNLSTDQSCALGGTGSHNNVTDTQLNLGPLEDNGGSALTQEPGPGSIAIDAIPAGDTTLCTGTDERGVARPQGNGCDIGAVEVASPDTDVAISAPHDITIPAGSPTGAAVTYPLPTVSDPDDAIVSTAVCSPASGSNFAIGTTTVTCSATDVDDTPQSATTTFVVTVEGAGTQLSELASAVEGVGPGTSLDDKVGLAQSALASGHISDTCSALTEFNDEVKAQAGKSIPAGQAAQLIANAQRIHDVLAC